MKCYRGDYKAHRIRALALRVKSRLHRTRYRLLTRDWSMAQLPIGRTVEGREMRMHSSLVDWPPGRKDARWRGGLWLCVDLPLREYTLLCVMRRSYWGWA